jgi:hypothetical protein
MATDEASRSAHDHFLALNFHVFPPLCLGNDSGPGPREW